MIIMGGTALEICNSFPSNHCVTLLWFIAFKDELDQQKLLEVVNIYVHS